MLVCSSLLRQHLSLCWLSSHQSGGVALASVASWNSLIHDLAELPFSAFFFSLGVLYFFTSVFFVWVLELLTIIISTVTLWFVFLFVLSCRALAYGLCHSSATIFSVKLHQGHPVVPHQFSPWARDSRVLGWRLRGCSYLEMNGSSKWLSCWEMGRSCCICFRCSRMALLDKKKLKIVACAS